MKVEVVADHDNFTRNVADSQLARLAGLVLLRRICCTVHTALAERQHGPFATADRKPVANCQQQQDRCCSHRLWCVCCWPSQQVKAPCITPCKHGMDIICLHHDDHTSSSTQQPRNLSPHDGATWAVTAKCHQGHIAYETTRQHCSARPAA